MPRKPNYRFERSQRDKSKATKKAARIQAKADKLAARKQKDGDGEIEAGTEIETGTQDRQE